MNETRKLKNSEKVRAIQEFLNNENDNVIDYDVESFQKAIKDFLKLKTIPKSDDDLPSLIENFVFHFQGKKDNETSKGIHEDVIQGKKKDTEIDFNRTTNSDLIDEALQPVRGMMAILTSMALSTRGADNEFQGQSYDVLHVTCSNVLDKFEQLKSQVDYMEDVIRGDA